jgi:tetratricopeptide (TPR) repeat protein
MALVLPFALLALDVWPRRRAPWRQLILEKWPFWLLAAAAGIVALVGQQTTGAVVGTEQHGFDARLSQALHGLVFYVGKTLWPGELMVFYPLPNPPRFDALSGLVLLAALVLLVVYRKRVPAVVVALAAYALIVAPVLGFVQTGSQLVAARYSYLAALPLALLAGGGLALLARRFGSAALALGLLVVVPLGIASARTCAVWHDTFSLWKNDIALAPAEAPARRNLIVAWVDKARAARDPAERRAAQEAALAEVQAGLRFGDDAAYHLNAAKVYDMRADDEPEKRVQWLELALAEARKSVDFVEHSRQRLPEAYEGAGAILCKLERPKEALPYFEKLAAFEPRSVQRLGMLAEARLQAGDRDGASKAYRALLELVQPGDADYLAAMQALREISAGR